MENNSNSVFIINARWLLYVYAIAPILLAVVLVDINWFDKSLVQYMGLGSMLLPWYLLFFELPHIVGSFLGFADKEYLVHYRYQLLTGLPIIIIVTVGMLYWNPTAAIVLYLVATMYHVIRQQTGVALMLGASRGVAHSSWAWSGIVLTSLMYVYFILPAVFPVWSLATFNTLIFFLMVLFFSLGIWVRYKSVKRVARSYVLYTTLLFLLGYLFILWGYLFFAFFVVRFVHDITAFFFYIAHETNRNSSSLHNVIYQSLKAVPIPVYVLVPLLSIAIAYGIRVGVTDQSILYALVILFGFTHYYLESLIWKRDALHRREIKLQ